MGIGNVTFVCKEPMRDTYVMSLLWKKKQDTLELFSALINTLLCQLLISFELLTYR